MHGQATFVQQDSDGFHAPYSGANSLSPASGRETADVTLALGVKPWQGAELWVTPEVDQGFGLDNTLGLAGFPSAEAYKVGSNQPYFRMPRYFLRQTIDVGEDRDDVVDSDINQFAGAHSTDRWVFTVGKLSVPDVFDTNQYAHDPKHDFLNWTAVDVGSFDYAADAWGYTIGAAAERYIGSWTLRAGVFDLSDVPNSEALEHGLHEFQMVAEIERRYPLFGQTGRILLTGFDSRGHMGLLDQAIDLAEATATTPNTEVRSYRGRMGASLDLEQPITANVGVFARYGKAGGNVEAYEFTDVDRSLSVGTSIKGAGWHRADDTIGVAVIDNGISAEREEYLNLGGLGILVGDGKLPHPGAEQILESYYSVGALSWLQITVDYQWVRNPAYNTDRGPVSIFALRLHAQI